MKPRNTKSYVRRAANRQKSAKSPSAANPEQLPTQFIDDPIQKTEHKHLQSTTMLAQKALEALTAAIEAQEKSRRSFSARIAAMFERLSDREPLALLKTLQKLGIAVAICFGCTAAALGCVLYVYKDAITTRYLHEPVNPKTDEVNDHHHSVASREVADKQLMIE